MREDDELRIDFRQSGGYTGLRLRASLDAKEVSPECAAEIRRALAAVDLDALAAMAPPQAQGAYQEQIKTYQAIAQDQEDKKKIQQADADKADKTYNELNFHDDQFDLSDAMLALAISLLAMTALTQKRWLFVLAMVPTLFGVVMGLAGLFGWNIHPNVLTRLLS